MISFQNLLTKTTGLFSISCFLFFHQKWAKKTDKILFFNDKVGISDSMQSKNSIFSQSFICNLLKTKNILSPLQCACKTFYSPGSFLQKGRLGINTLGLLDIADWWMESTNNQPAKLKKGKYYFSKIDKLGTFDASKIALSKTCHCACINLRFYWKQWSHI